MRAFIDGVIEETAVGENNSDGRKAYWPYTWNGSVVRRHNKRVVAGALNML